MPKEAEMVQFEIFVHTKCKKAKKEANEWIKKNHSRFKIKKILQSLTRAEFVITVVYKKRPKKK